MRNLMPSGTSDGASFLPDDYVSRQHDRRTNIIGLTLFFVVITGVLGAFFVTNQRWSDVQEQQEAINTRYQEAAKEIEQLKRLEEQKVEMLARATLTASLKERAPRSIVLAELLNRMPEDVALTTVTLKSKKIAARRQAVKPTTATARTRSLSSGAGQPAQEEESRPEPPSYLTTLMIEGMAESHNNVAAYVSTLQTCPLLSGVELRFSELAMVDERSVNKFRIEAMLDSSADAREIEPLTLSQARHLGIGLNINETRMRSVADADEDRDEEEK